MSETDAANKKTAVDEMKEFLETDKDKALHARRKNTVEPVFGVIIHNGKSARDRPAAGGVGTADGRNFQSRRTSSFPFSGISPFFQAFSKSNSRAAVPLSPMSLVHSLTYMRTNFSPVSSAIPLPKRIA